MQANLRHLIAAAALTVGVAAQATPVVLVDQGASYQYKTLNTDLWSGSTWAAGVGLSTFDNFAAANPISGWSTGNAVFAGSPAVPGGTVWAPNTDLAIYKTFNVTDVLTGSLTLNVASDNGFMIFLNDQLVAKENAEGYTFNWEYTITLTPSSNYVNMGTNVLKILAEDHGGSSYFDMKLTGHVPEPGSLALAGLALLAAGVARRRKAA